MRQARGTQPGSEHADAIRPFQVSVPETELTELRRHEDSYSRQRLSRRAIPRMLGGLAEGDEMSANEAQSREATGGTELPS